MIFLVDGDVYVYYACYASTKEVVFDDISSMRCDHDDLRNTLKNVLTHHLRVAHRELELTDKATVRVALSCRDRSSNWRKKVLPSYKATRKPGQRPLGFDTAEEWLRANYRVVQVDTLEADDLLGIWATEEPPAAIFSTDKDMLQLPAVTVRPRFGEQGNPTLTITTLDQANHFHLVQTLVGDSVDNYKGCPGVGPKTAEKILAGKTGNEAWLAVVAAYAKKNLTEDDALVQARVARILRCEEWEPKQNEVTLWTPSST